MECGCVDGITREVIMIELCLRDVNREDGVVSAVFYALREWRKPSSEDTQLKHLQPFSGPTDDGTPSTACASFDCLPS